MNKQERMKIVKDLAFTQDYTILDGTHEYPKHIRINGICDIWPTTGTLKINGNKGFFKGSKGVYKFAEILDKKLAVLDVKKGMREEINELKQIIKSMDIQLNHLTECMEDIQFTIESTQLPRIN